jgi:Tol biopolymer transport system component
MARARAPAAAVSQDGSRIAFAARDDPLGTNGDFNSEIFLYDGARLIQVTNTSPGNISERAANGNFQPSISDDGRFIAFASNRNLTNQNGDANLEIFVYDSITATFAQTTNSSGTLGFSAPKISGDGNTLAFIRDTGQTPGSNRDLLLQDRQTLSVIGVPAVNSQGLNLTYGRAISDDGLRIVWSAETAPDTSQVFLFDGRNNITRQITTLGARSTDVPLHPSISGEGSRISFATRRPVLPGNSDNSIEVYTFDISINQFARVTNAPAAADGFDGSRRELEVVTSLCDDGSIVAFNFPRLLSGPVANPDFVNNSEIYVTGTAPRPPFGTLTVLNRASFGHEPSSVKAVAPESIAVALGSAPRLHHASS